MTEFILIGSIGAEVIENLSVRIIIIFGIMIRCVRCAVIMDDTVLFATKVLQSKLIAFVTLTHKLVSINGNFNE